MYEVYDNFDSNEFHFLDALHWQRSQDKQCHTTVVDNSNYHHMPSSQNNYFDHSIADPRLNKEIYLNGRFGEHWKETVVVEMLRIKPPAHVVRMISVYI